MIQFNVQFFGQGRRAVTDAQPHRKDNNVKFFSNTVSLFVDIADKMSSICIPGFNMRDSRFDKSNTQILADKAAGWLFYIALAVAVLTTIA